MSAAWRLACAGPWLAAGCSVVLALPACVEPDADRGDPHYSAPPQGIAAASIDTGASVALEAGSGIGVAVEYAGAGQWRLLLACDTLVSEASCSFDVLVSTNDDAGISAFEGLDLEPEDTLSALDPFELQLDFLTEADADGVGFTTAPGATVRVSPLLYDSAFDSRFAWDDDPRIMSWVSHGAVNWGAPTNPLDLTPDRP